MSSLLQVPSTELIPSEMPERPWQKVGSDLFELKVSPYYSHFVEIAKLTPTTSTNVITHLKSVFAHHGIPQVLISDNGPQYSAEAFEKFARVWLNIQSKVPTSKWGSRTCCKDCKTVAKEKSISISGIAFLQRYSSRERVQPSRTPDG